MAEQRLRWLDGYSCHVCGGAVNSWDRRCSQALGYKHIVCEADIAKEYDVSVDELRNTMKDHFGMLPCPGI